MFDLTSSSRSKYANAEISLRLLGELSDPRSVAVSSSQQIGYLLLNRQLIGEEKPIIAIGGFMSDVTTPDRAWEGANLATLGRPVLMLDMPGHGQSSPHSKEQIVDLCVRRSVDKQAEPLTDAVQKLLHPEDAIDYFGISHGSYLALKATEQDPKDRVDTIFGLDLPAVKKRFTLGLQLGYIIADNIIGKRKYFDQIEASVLERDYDLFRDLHDSLNVKRASSFIQNNPGLLALGLLFSVNARPGALTTWQSVLETTSASVKVVTAENSSVSDPEAIDTFIGTLPQAFQDRSSQLIIPGEDHNIGMVRLIPRTVQWAKDAFEY
jgi:pimeloyl-ACP methyl ester carboxylesterase